MERSGLVREGRLEDNLPAPERSSRQLPHRASRISDRARWDRVGGHRYDREVLRHEWMSRVDITRGDDDRTPVRTDVIEDSGEGPRYEGKGNESPLADQSTSAGERTTTAIAASTVR